MSRRVEGYTLRRAALTGVAIGAFVVALAATAAVLKGEADPGVDPALPGQNVRSVAPTGFAWRDGIRAGQVVVALSAADDPGGWRLETLDAQGLRVVSEAARADAGLRASLPLGLAALFAGGIALVVLRTARKWVLPAAWTACMAASTPLALQGTPLFSTLALAGAAVLAGSWIVSRVQSTGLRYSLVGSGLLALAYWGSARLSGWATYDDIDPFRATLAVLGGAALVADQTVGRRPATERFRMIRPEIAEVVIVAVVAGVAIALVTLFEVSPAVMAIAIIAIAIALPALRRRLRPIEDALLADVRAQAAADAAETERGRLARELHDVPLQELIGAIRRIEILPGGQAVSDDLRALAGHLRNVAVDLRPPVLDDLGLPAALEQLADETSGQGIAVESRVKDETTFDREQRPPAEIELAFFRIATEAVTNAVRHSGASAISISGEIGPRRVQVEIVDNGHGLAPDAAESRRGKHIGMSSMKRRAQAIDADLSIRSAADGTEVRVQWQA